jgi:hypothetical protein
MNDNGREYRVGYGKPPAATRFKKGTSGNRSGRPRSSPSFDSILDKELGRTVVVVENGLRSRISKQTAIVKRLVNKAASGEKNELKILAGELFRREKAPRRQEEATDVCEKCQRPFLRGSREEHERRINELLDKAGLRIVPKSDGSTES